MANTFKSAVTKDVGTSNVSVYTVPAAKTAVLIGITMANTTASQITVNAVLTRSGTDYYIIKSAIVPSGSAFVWTGGELKTVVMTGDIIKVASSDAASVDVVLSYLEIA